MRSVPEWIGKTDDEEVPQRVRTRIFDRYGGRCYLTGVKLGPKDWDLDHIIALINGGKHRESNLAPAYKPAHRAKTKNDLKLKSKLASLHAKHVGAARPKRKMKSRVTAKKERRPKLPCMGVSEIQRRMGQ